MSLALVSSFLCLVKQQSENKSVEYIMFWYVVGVQKEEAWLNDLMKNHGWIKNKQMPQNLYEVFVFITGFLI